MQTKIHFSSVRVMSRVHQLPDVELEIATIASALKTLAQASFYRLRRNIRTQTLGQVCRAAVKEKAIRGEAS